MNSLNAPVSERASMLGIMNKNKKEWKHKKKTKLHDNEHHNHGNNNKQKSRDHLKKNDKGIFNRQNISYFILATKYPTCRHFSQRLLAFRNTLNDREREGKIDNNKKIR